MKAFEKWNGDDNSGCTVVVACGNITCSECKKIKKHTWKAALKMALAQETVKPLLGGTKHRYIDSIVIRNELKDELES